MEKIITQQQIQQRIKELADAISQEHRESETTLPPVLICVLNGAMHFFSDLSRAMTINHEIDFVRLKSYDKRDNSGGVLITKSLELDLRGKRVYIVDDICDSGTTIMEMLFMVNSHIPASVKVVTLLKRRGGVDLTNYCGFELGDEWVVGYGLDDDLGLNRELQDIYKVN
jgi:hypoxanthine phosphoribosyltransferase